MKNQCAAWLVMSAVLVSGGMFAGAQTLHGVKANIPFAFYVGSTKLPAGTYILRDENGSDLSMMEIVDGRGDISALFGVRNSSDGTNASKGSLTFHHTSKGYFLTKVYGTGSRTGSAVDDTGYSKQYGASREAGEDKVIPAE